MSQKITFVFAGGWDEYKYWEMQRVMPPAPEVEKVVYVNAPEDVLGYSYDNIEIVKYGTWYTKSWANQTIALLESFIRRVRMPARKRGT